MWNPTGGRFVDKGEWFRETDPRSRFNRTYRPPRHAPFTKRANEVELSLFEQVCEKVAAGADIDFTVKAADAANVADLARNADSDATL